jgi:inhibitor of cysteine peptidase
MKTYGIRLFMLPLWLLLLAATICGGRMAGAATVKIGDTDNGTTIHLKTGDTVEVQLKANPSTGYMWFIRPKSTSLLKLAGQTTTEPTESGVGRPVFQIFRFTAIKVGEGDLLFHYVRSWEPPADNETRFTLHLTVE